MTNNYQKSKIDYKRVFLFLTIAISLSNIFRFDIFNVYPVLGKWSKFVYLFSIHFLEESGVIIGALLALYLLLKERKTEITFWGTSRNKGLLMSIIPLALLTVIGVNNKYGINMHLYGFIAGFGTLIYCILEEYVWRGYLEEEFKGLKTLFRVLLIGFIWYFWHLSFFTEATFVQNIFFLGTLIFGSWISTKLGSNIRRIPC
jgi:uncharacterized protein